MKIIDNLIEPYQIVLTSHSYDVVQPTNNKDKKGIEIFKTHGHFSNVESALNKISKLLVETDKTYTVKEYVSLLNDTRIKLKTINK